MFRHIYDGITGLSDAVFAADQSANFGIGRDLREMEQLLGKFAGNMDFLLFVHGLR
jgi:hypothetical protein